MGRPHRADAGAGDDRIVYDPLDAVVQAGSGTDTLVVGADKTLVDFTLLRDDIFFGFEVLDLTASGSQSVKIADADVYAMTSNRILRVDGAAADGVRLVGNWALDTSNGSGLFDAGSVKTHDAYITSYLPSGSVTPVTLTIMVPVLVMVFDAISRRIRKALL